jgi:hypothetical protein
MSNITCFVEAIVTFVQWINGRVACARQKLLATSNSSVQPVIEPNHQHMFGTVYQVAYVLLKQAYHTPRVRG